MNSFILSINRSYLPVFALLWFFLYSCAPPPQSDPYIYSNSGLQFDIRADQHLNRYDGEPHTVKLAIYQLTDNGPFLEQLKKEKGSQKLLRISKFDPSVVGYDQLIIKPNESSIYSFDRITQAKWVGIVAGYYCTDNTTYPFASVKIPSIPKKKSFFRKTLEFFKILSSYELQYVPKMSIQLQLTPETMYETSVFQ
jgi:type VI secretion system VasD/TssJ family lipoprotein